MKTRVINCAKVTRADGKFRDEPSAVKTLRQKLSALIRRHGLDEAHATLTIKDKPTNHAKKYKPSSLCAALTKLRKKGVRVLDFDRGGDGWQIKTMVPL